ncbi:MAG: hypothetical protein LBO73_03380 [Holosporaceae bacterium]|nr:hypothetical protein [Holosporaceae bacterium]
MLENDWQIGYSQTADFKIMYSEIGDANPSGPTSLASEPESPNPGKKLLCLEIRAPKNRQTQVCASEAAASPENETPDVRRSKSCTFMLQSEARRSAEALFTREDSDKIIHNLPRRALSCETLLLAIRRAEDNPSEWRQIWFEQNQKEILPIAEREIIIAKNEAELKRKKHFGILSSFRKLFRTDVCRFLQIIDHCGFGGINPSPKPFFYDEVIIRTKSSKGCPKQDEEDFRLMLPEMRKYLELIACGDAVNILYKISRSKDDESSVPLWYECLLNIRERIKHLNEILANNELSEAERKACLLDLEEKKQDSENLRQILVDLCKSPKLRETLYSVVPPAFADDFLSKVVCDTEEVLKTLFLTALDLDLEGNLNESDKPWILYSIFHVDECRWSENADSRVCQYNRWALSPIIVEDENDVFNYVRFY